MDSMGKPKPIGDIVGGVFEDIQRRYAKPGRDDSTEDFAASGKIQLTGKDMLAYLSNEIRRRGIGRGKRQKV